MTLTAVRVLSYSSRVKQLLSANLRCKSHVRFEHIFHPIFKNYSLSPLKLEEKTAIPLNIHLHIQQANSRTKQTHKQPLWLSLATSNTKSTNFCFCSDTKFLGIYELSKNICSSLSAPNSFTLFSVYTELRKKFRT